MSKERIERYIDYSIFLYIFLFMLYGFVARIIPLYMYINEPINSYFFVFFAGTGCLLILVDIIDGRHLFKGKYCWVLYAFIVVMVVSSLINIQYGYIDNIKTVIWTTIQVALFYSMYTRTSKEIMMKYIYISFHLISWIWTLAVVYSLKQFVTMEAYGIEIYPGDWRRQGFRDNRLFGIFNDPNYAAVTCVYVVFMLLYIMQKTKKKWLKCVCVLACVTHGIYILLSGSRTAKICILVTFFVYIFLLLKNQWAQDSISMSILKRIGIGTITVGVLIFAGIILGKVVVNIPSIYAEYVVTDAKEDVSSRNVVEKELELQRAQNVLALDEQNMLDRQDTDSGTSNLRLKIWKNYLQGTEGCYIIGTSPRNVEKYIEANHPGVYERSKWYETHNGFLSVFVGTGVVGLGFVLLFMILIGKKIVNYCFGKNPICIEFVTIFSVLIVILIYTCFFTELFFVNNLTTTIFWSLLGSLMYWIDNVKEKSIKNEKKYEEWHISI